MELPWYYASWTTWKMFVKALLPTGGSMVAMALTNVIYLVLVARAGDVWSVSVYGLSNFFLSLVVSPLANTLAEVSGIFFALHFGARRFDQVGDYLYKALLIMGGIFGLLFLLSLHSSNLLKLIDIEEDMANAAGRLILASNLFIPFMYTNRVLCAFMGAQKVSRHFYTLTAVSVTLTIILGNHFVSTLGMKEMGIVPTKLIIEGLILVLNLYYVATRSKPECLVLPNPRTLFQGLTSFLRRIVFAAVSVFMNYLTLEFNLYLAALMHSADALALWTTYANFGAIFSYLSYGISAVVRSHIGHIIGQGDFVLARRECLAYYFYIFLVSLILGLATVLCAGLIAELYFTDVPMQQRLVPALILYACFMFWFLLTIPSFGVFRMLGRDGYFFWIIVVLFPILVVTINTALVYFWELGVTGLFLGNGIATLAVSLVFLHKLFVTDVWNKSAVRVPFSELETEDTMSLEDGRGSLALIPIEMTVLGEKQEKVLRLDEELLRHSN